MNTPSQPSKRKHVRFKPDFGDFCYIDRRHDRNEFKPDVAAFLVNLSPMGGCSVVIHDDEGINSNDILTAKVGKLSPMKMKVCWVKRLDENLLRLGLQFLE